MAQCSDSSYSAYEVIQYERDFQLCRRKLETAPQTERELGGGELGAGFLQWIYFIAFYYPSCKLAPVRNTEELAKVKAFAEKRIGSEPAIVGVFKDLEDAQECKTDGEDCTMGWKTFFGPVDDDEDLWASGQPNGEDSDDGDLVATIANLGGNAATLYDNAPDSFFNYAV